MAFVKCNIKFSKDMRSTVKDFNCSRKSFNVSCKSQAKIKYSFEIFVFICSKRIQVQDKTSRQDKLVKEIP